jgi:DNA-directed RNA polymerase specialized sigma24 family protein
MKKSELEDCLAYLNDPDIRQSLTRYFQGPDTDDAVQEVYLRVLQGKRAIVSEPLDYLHSIALDVAAESLQRSTLPIQVLNALHPSGMVDPLEAAEHTSELLHRHQTLAEQSTPQHAKMHLLRGEGWSYKEIARLLKMSCHTVKKYLSKSKPLLTRSILKASPSGKGGADAPSSPPSAEETAPCKAKPASKNS